MSFPPLKLPPLQGIPIQRGPLPRTTTPEDERVIVGEAVRVNHQKRRARRRFLVRRHTSAWCRLFPNTPAWLVLDRETGEMSTHATWDEAYDHVEAVAIGEASDREYHDHLHQTRTPHRYIPGYGWTPVEEPSA